jgi:hypothetical protein
MRDKRTGKPFPAAFPSGSFAEPPANVFFIQIE